MKLRIKQEDWLDAAVIASILSQQLLMLGSIFQSQPINNNLDSIEIAKQSIQLADKSSDKFINIVCSAVLADALHQAGKLAKARDIFVNTEKLQKKIQPEYPLLFSGQGFYFCDVLLTAGNWKEAQQRAQQTLKYRYENWYSSLSTGLDKLSLGRSYLQQAINQITANKGIKTILPSNIAPDSLLIEKVHCINLSAISHKNQQEHHKIMQTAKNWIYQAVDDLRKAGQEDLIVRSLLIRANYHRWSLLLTDIYNSTGMEKTNKHMYISKKVNLQEIQNNALQDLQEAYELTNRGNMRLHLTDYYLESARLMLTIKQPTSKRLIKEHIKNAKQLIEKTGYKRRLPELKQLEDTIS